MKIQPEQLLFGGILATAGLTTLYFTTRPKPAFSAQFAGFQVSSLKPGTTTRRATEETAKEFRFYPLINLTPDVNGDFSIFWDWRNFFDGAPAGYSEPKIFDCKGLMFSIKNDFPGLVAGRQVQLQLVDGRPYRPGDPANVRGGAIAIGDDDFIAEH
jgi:hypothetical protein